MVSLTALWLPILLSAVAVFVANSALHRVLTFHRSDYSAMPGEDNVQAAMRAEEVAPGHYYLPLCVDMKEMGDPEMKAKFDKGPVAFVTMLVRLEARLGLLRRLTGRAWPSRARHDRQRPRSHFEYVQVLGRHGGCSR